MRKFDLRRDHKNFFPNHFSVSPGEGNIADFAKMYEQFQNTACVTPENSRNPWEAGPERRFMNGGKEEEMKRKKRKKEQEGGGGGGGCNMCYNLYCLSYPAGTRSAKRERSRQRKKERNSPRERER